MKTPRRQRPKAGKVVRLNPQTWRLVERERTQAETIDATIRRLLRETPRKLRSYYLLPKSGVICNSMAEARGMATVLHVRSGKRLKLEEPIELIEIKKESK